jgi:hypothetical protein
MEISLLEFNLSGEVRFELRELHELENESYTCSKLAGLLEFLVFSFS